MTIDAVLVDTDVVSFLLKDDTRAQAYRPLLTNKTLVLSFMTVAELYHWAFRRNWSERRLAWLEERLRAFVIAPYDHELCRQWAIICVERQRLGKPIEKSGSLTTLIQVTSLYRDFSASRANHSERARSIG